MKLRIRLIAIFAIGLLTITGCNKRSSSTSSSTPSPAATVDRRVTPSALPENGFKAQVALVDAPAKLRAGEKTTVQVRVKNMSDVLWYARGAEVNTSSDNRFYLAAGNRWLKTAGEQLVTDMDGRYGLNKDLKPGEETEVPLLITAPKDTGDYILEIDVVQEQVAWFHDKGSPTAKTRITVVR